MRAMKFDNVQSIVMWNFTMTSALPKWRLTVCSVLHPERCSSFNWNLSGEECDRWLITQPSAFWACLRVAGQESADVPGLCHWGRCGYPSDAPSPTASCRPAASRGFSSRCHAGCLCLQMGPAGLGHPPFPHPFPGTDGGLFHPHKFPEKTAHRTI